MIGWLHVYEDCDMLIKTLNLREVQGHSLMLVISSQLANLVNG